MRAAKLLGLLVAYAALEVGERALDAAGAAIDVGEEIATELMLVALRWEASRG